MSEGHLRSQMLLSMARRKWRWRGQTVDRLLHAPEEVSPEALQHLQR